MTSETDMVTTVLGPVPAATLGATYMHEHVIVDNSFSGNNPLKRLDEEDVLIWELQDVKRAGGGTIVDCTCDGLGPDPAALRRIAAAAGLHVVASTGFYRPVVYPEFIRTESADRIAARLIADCTDGFGDTGVRPGMLAEFASHDPTDMELDGGLHPDNEKVFRAAARAHLATGLPITTHCWLGAGADWEIGVFRDEGVDPSRVVIGHVGICEPDLDRVRHILDQGVNIGIDGIGYGERDNMTFFEHDKAHLVKMVVDWGHIDQITVSLDMTRKYHLKKYGGHGFAMLMDWFAPLLREVGLSSRQVDQILVANPCRILTPRL